MARFDEIFVGRENRKSDYRTWSERAVVVGHNVENNSYNVVITTEKTLGDNVRTTNRVIRNVKSVLRPGVKTFFPGESIVVGYVDDRREHPIIVGEGDSAGHTCIKVTLGITSNIPEIEGPTAPSLVAPEFNVFFPLEISCFDPNVLGAESQTGLTCTINCTKSVPEIRLTAVFGKPPYTWTLPLTGPAGCSFGGVGGPGLGPPTPDSVNDSRLVITAPSNSGGSSLATKLFGFAFSKFSPVCVCTQSNGCSETFDCDGNFLAATSSVSGACASVPSVCDRFPSAAAACPDPTVCITPACDPANGPGGFGPCDNNEDLHRFDNVLICDVRSQSTIDAGCCPCELAFNDLVVTVSDAAGTMISMTIKVASP